MRSKIIKGGSKITMQNKIDLERLAKLAINLSKYSDIVDKRIKLLDARVIRLEKDVRLYILNGGKHGK